MLLWTLCGLCPSHPHCRAALAASSLPIPSVVVPILVPTPLPSRLAPRSLCFRLLVSVSKVTQTASLSSPELPAGFPDAVHHSGCVSHCFSWFSHTFPLSPTVHLCPSPSLEVLPCAGASRCTPHHLKQRQRCNRHPFCVIFQLLQPEK